MGSPTPGCHFPLATSTARRTGGVGELLADKPGPGGVGLQERYGHCASGSCDKFRSDDWVIGYDVMNEPWPGPEYATCETDAGCPALEQTFWHRSTPKQFELFREPILGI